ncbi:allantoicase [Panus rudis PR-1116 ss-1]|nr:allantoicase [Panus rudis PR-1116 ss-1]
MSQVPLEQFSEVFGTSIELSSVALGGQICSVSDEFFAEAYHLLLVEPAPSLKGQFGPKGALYSGWETRRHNPSYDWCIIKLGAAGSIFGFDIDTSHFNGNEAPQVSIEALFADSTPNERNSQWQEILPKVNVGPNSRHLFRTPPTGSVNYVKLNMYPDGGIARFRAYGLVTPVLPLKEDAVYDLAHVLSGGRVVYTSDQHFGVGSNLILPGRGKDMSDGWETRRSRQPGHKDWAILKLGSPGYLSYAEIDTAHFMGNFPESCELHATYSESLIPSDTSDNDWSLILPRSKLGPHRQHQFQLENTKDKPFTHVRVTIYPDGGIKRVRLFGSRVPSPLQQLNSIEGVDTSTVPSSGNPAPSSQAFVADAVVASHVRANRSTTAIPALSLTAEAFTPYGRVVQAYADINAVPNPRQTRITGANQGTAVKFHKLALLDEDYPSGSGATTGLSVYRCKPIAIGEDGVWPVKLLERHPHTNQAFIPMGAGAGTSDGLEKPGSRYLVIVAKNGEDDKPDLTTLRAFVAAASQGIVYDKGIWHHPMAVLDAPIDFTCVEAQIGDGSALDCEIIDLDEHAGFPLVKITN